MKVLLISGSYPPLKCGVGDYTKNLCDSLLKLNYDVTVLTSKNVNNRNDNVLAIIDKWGGFKLIKEICSVASKEYDIIHIQFPALGYTESIWNYLLPFWLRIAGKKVVYTIHEYYRPRRHVFSLIFSNNIILVDDKFLDKIHRKYKKLFDKKIKVIHIGANVPKSQASKEEVLNLRNIIVNKQNISFSKVVSYFGFINPNKRIEIILEAMKQLKDKNKLDTLLMIMGDYRDISGNIEEYQNYIKKLITEFELSEYVYFTGFLNDDDVGTYFRCSDASILLFNEGVSCRNGSFLAAQQEGIPVYTTKPERDFKVGTNITFINNTVEDVVETLLNIQQQNNINESADNYINPWEEIAAEHDIIYHELCK